ncbi:MAG: 50S ribosomal protein L22 [Candidatus Desulforudis sp.]|nr:50S ribosomal protein L22 [Desulforudis sp.]
METKAVAKYIRLSPVKVRQVVDLVRGKKVDEALAILQFTPKRAARSVAKVIRSAAANAEHNNDSDRAELFIARAYVDQGPSLKRWRPRAYGRANVIKHRTSHITVVVSDGKEG